MKISNKMHVKNGLNIIIVGCGKVGMTLIEQLSKEGHDITIIDKNAAKVQEMSNLYDIMGLVGNGASYSVQMEAGIENADLSPGERLSPSPCPREGRRSWGAWC